MYDSNFLLKQLRQASIGNDEAVFAKLDDDSIVTYGELFSNAEKIASLLVKEGLKPNERVLVQVDKSIQSVELYLGVMLAGGIFIPLNTAYIAEEISYFLTDATPAFLVSDPEKLSTLEPLVEQVGMLKTFTLDQDGKGSLMEAANKEATGFTGVARTKDDLASIIYTSGTTGRSKGAMLTGSNLSSNASILSDYWKFSNKDILIHSLPIFHVHGLFVAINITLMTGSKLIFHKSFDVNSILSDMNYATVLMGVPTFYVRLLHSEGLNKSSTNNMRLFVSGSAPMLEETHKQWQKRTGHSIIERYGMSETNMNTSNPYEGIRKAGTVGLPLPNVEVIVANPETGDLLKTGEVGSVEIRGPNVFSGYWNMPKKTAEEIRENGFFITGDLGVYDEDGYLSIVGRSKDLVISGGYNIYPKELELLIDDIAGVNESAVIGLPDEDFGEKVAAVIVKDNTTPVNENIIFEELESKLARFKQPKHVIFVDELPRNTMGKVQKNTLREAYQNI